MPEILLRLTDDLAAFLADEAAHEGHAGIEDYLRALAMDRHEARMARVRALMEAGDAATLDALREATRRRYREGGG